MWPFNILFKNDNGDNPSETLGDDIKFIKGKLLGRISDGERSFVGMALKKHSEILSAVGSIESGLKTFENSQVGSTEMDSRLRQILEGNKNTISKKIHDLCKGLKSFAGNDADSIISYHVNSYAAFSDTVSSSMENYKKIEEYLDRQIIPIFKNVNYVAGLLESFKKEIENFQLRHGKMKSLENLISKLEIQISNKEDLINRKHLLEKELENLEYEKSSVGTQLNELINTNEYKEFSRLISGAEALKHGLDKNRIMFMNYMSALGRPMKKFMKLVCDKEVAFEHGDGLSDFLDNQELTRGNILVIQVAVEKMGPVTEKLGLKGKNGIKPLNRMKEILDGKILNELYEEKMKIKNELEHIENQITLRKQGKRFELEERLDKTTPNIILVKNDLTKLEKDAVWIGKLIEESKQRLEYESKEIFNEDIRIKI